MTHGSVRDKMIIVLIVTLGAILTVGAAVVDHTGTMRDADDLMARRALVVSEAVKASARSVMGAATAGAALFEASDTVTAAEFHRFARSAGSPSEAVGLVYVPVVTPRDRASFLAAARAHDPDFPMPPDDDTETWYPVLYSVSASPNDPDITGLDAGADLAWRETLERATQTHRTSVSRLTQLFGQEGAWGFLAVAPVVENAEVVGYATAVARLDQLVQPELASSLEEVITWSVSDVGSAVAFVSPDPLRRVLPVVVGGRIWQVDVSPTDRGRAELTGSSLALTIAIGALLTLLAVVIGHLVTRSLRAQRQTEELRRLTEEKDEFLTALSHELRTPLTVVVGMAEILGEATLDSGDDVREYVGMLRRESDELSRLVDDLLLLGRLDAEVLPLRPKPVDVSWEIERIFREVDLPSGVDLTHVGEGAAWADPLRLRHILRHLISNALEHGGNTVVVRVVDSLSEIRVTVSDDGEGVAPDRMSDLFVASPGHKETPGGPATLGLGLRVSRRLAHALGGDLAYRRVGGYSVFELRLPRVPRATVEPRQSGKSPGSRGHIEEQRS